MQRAEARGISIRHIQQNAYDKRCDRTVSRECLEQYTSKNIEDVQDFATRLWANNSDQPDRKIGGTTTHSEPKTTR